MKQIVFKGTSRAVIQSFAKEAKQKVGFELNAVQQGDLPSNWKPMKTIGAGVNEIRVKVNNQYRVIYVAKFSEAIYVLHAFIKKTQKTVQPDIEMAKKYYQTLLEERKRK